VTVRELGGLIRSGKASSLEIVQDSLRQVKERDRCRTFITITEEEAINEAIERDKELAAGIDRGPFHGIPVAYKDLFFTRGVKTTAGSLLYRDFVPGYDATVVDKLRVGGAVSLGKLNLHELAYGATSKNPHYGFVLNPHNSGHVAGGSSGGSATAIAQGFVPVTLGSDTGGSIRIPASYCGVAGFKPTYGLVSRYGVFPLSYSLDHVGPLGSSVEDCSLAMAEIAGRDARDRTTLNAPGLNFYKPALRNLASVRVGVPTNYYFDHVAHDVARSIQTAILEMERLGATVSEIALPDITEINAAARIIQWGESASVYSKRTDRKLFGADVWALLEQGRLVSASDYVTAQKLRTVFRKEFDEIWEAIDLLIAPATPITAPRTDEDQIEIDGYREDARIASTRMTRAINLIGEPALSIPCGLSGSGLPIGLQLMAAPFRDAWLLRVGQMVERALSETQVSRLPQQAPAT
jgi:aspartyl-tRNA(Asn)/glutamyl-tRNA(Gln) amidotransferase subunit A